MDKWTVGMKLRSLVDAQGMQKDDVVVVVDVLTRHTAFGGFTTLVCTNTRTQAQINVGNAHLVLAEVSRG